MTRPGHWKAAIGLSAIVVALASGGTAHAATPFNVGTGLTPNVAVDSTGAGHVVWQIDDAGDRIGYCRVPKNATACDVAPELISSPTGAAAVGQEFPDVFTPGRRTGRRRRSVLHVRRGRRDRPALPLDLDEQRRVVPRADRDRRQPRPQRASVRTSTAATSRSRPAGEHHRRGDRGRHDAFSVSCRAAMSTRPPSSAFPGQTSSSRRRATSPRSRSRSSGTRCPSRTSTTSPTGAARRRRTRPSTTTSLAREQAAPACSSRSTASCPATTTSSCSATTR